VLGTHVTLQDTMTVVSRHTVHALRERRWHTYDAAMPPLFLFLLYISNYYFLQTYSLLLFSIYISNSDRRLDEVPGGSPEVFLRPLFVYFQFYTI
jgi:hypothetical protein